MAKLLLIAPFFFWGTAMVAMKQVMPHTTPFFVAGVRILPAGLIILFVAMLLGKSHPQGWRAWAWISLFALVDGLLFQGCLAFGLERTGAGLGSVMIDSQPLAVALLSRWLYREQVGLWGWLGLLLGIIGITCIGLPQDSWAELFQGNLNGFTWESLQRRGELWMLMAALAMAVGTILMQPVSRHTDPVMATGWHMVLGGIPLMALAIAPNHSPWIDLTTLDWLNLAYATLFGSAIAYGLFFYFAAKGNLTSLSSLTFLTPIFALSFGNLILDETLSRLQLLGVGLTLMSIYLINQRQSMGQWLQALPLSGRVRKQTSVTVKVSD